MKMLILATALLGATAIVPAAAGYSCGWIGQRWYCQDNSGGGQTSCGWIGQRWYCQ
jgi:hypothetical protein